VARRDRARAEAAFLRGAAGVDGVATETDVRDEAEVERDREDQRRRPCVHGIGLQRLVAALLAKLLHRFIEDSLCGALLAAPHHGIHELVDQRGVIDRIGLRLPLRNVSFSRHSAFSSWLLTRHLTSASLNSLLHRVASFWQPATNYALGRLAPYFERPCLRFATPTESSVPRTT